MMRCVCATHGRCFDGLASAALFSEIIELTEGKTAFEYISCGYGPGHTGQPNFDGDRNAILDYRYFPDDRLTHYFDHHSTAFVGDTEKVHFQSRSTGAPDRFLWDASAPSCTGMIARHAQLNWDLKLKNLEDLILWADKIDSANFTSAEEATSHSQPLMQLVSVVERFGSKTFITQAVPILRTEGLTALAEAKFVKNHFRSLEPKFAQYSQKVKERGVLKGNVVMVDLGEEQINVVTKFAQYREYPSATYSVVIAKMSRSIKISVGYNPWTTKARKSDIGAMCARHGGGGHPYVGAVSLSHDKKAQAHTLATQIAQQLREESE